MIEALQSRITHLEKHIEEQDAEIYKLARRVESLFQALQEQKAQLAELTESTSSSELGSPIDEKPPHY
jgi:uncharacterized coiled-coil protein SlyX